jgi:hypothetical protein
LFGANQTDFANEVTGLVLRLAELGTSVRGIKLTAQWLLDGVVRLAFEAGESKVDGGESRSSERAPARARGFGFPADAFLAAFTSAAALA